MRERLGELAVEIPRAGVEVRLEKRRQPPPRKHLLDRSDRRRQLARVVGVIVHINLPGRIDIKFETSLDPLERGQRLPQTLRIQRLAVPLRRAPERRHGRHGILDIDPTGNTQRAPFDNAAGRHQIVPIVTALEQRHVAGVKIARLVVRIAVNPDTGVPDLQIDTPLDDQRPAFADLADKLRESLAQCLVRTVNIQMIGIGRGDHRHVGPQPQERTVELVGLDRQTPAGAEHQVTRKIPGNTPQESASAARHPVVEPCHERRGRGFAVRTSHRHHELPL